VAGWRDGAKRNPRDEGLKASLFRGIKQLGATLLPHYPPIIFARIPQQFADAPILNIWVERDHVE